MGNEIKLTFAGDATALTRAFDQAGDGARDMAADMDKVDGASSRLNGAVKGVNGTIDSSESKFMGAADLLDGLSTSMGLNISPAIDMARAFGDMAGGFTALVGPAMDGLTAKLAKSTVATNIQTGAQRLLNATMKANPIFLVVGILAALAVAFVVAYKKSETFRAIVDKAMGGVKTAIGKVGGAFSGLIDTISDVVKRTGGVLGGVAEIITAPYRLAFRAIADLWNSSVGRLSFTVPGWVPGIGGEGFDVPDIPTFAGGGVARANQLAMVGERGPELFVPGVTGAVVPNSALGGGVTVILGSPGDPFTEAIRKTVRIVGGGNVQAAFGS